MKTTSYTLVLICGLSVSTSIMADFLVIPKPKPEAAPPINYDTPERGYRTPQQDVDSYGAVAPTISEHGVRSLFSKAMTPNLRAFDEPVSSLIADIVPKGMELKLVRTDALKDRVSFSSEIEKGWVDNLQLLLNKAELNAVINWKASTVTIRPNIQRTIVMDQTREVVDDSGTKYVIRKKSDDISAVQNNGYLIKDGKTFRLNIKE